MEDVYTEIWNIGRGDEFRFGHADFKVLLTYPQGDSKTVVRSKGTVLREEMQPEDPNLWVTCTWWLYTQRQQRWDHRGRGWNW